MRVKIKRKAKGSWHSTWVEELKRAVRFSASALDISKKNIKVDIVLKNDPSVDYAGVCLDIVPMRRFVLILNAAYVQDQDHILSLVFHEMTHVAQAFHQGFVWEEFETAHYEGMVYTFDDWDEFKDVYMSLPWEVDARKSEKKLLKRYKKLLSI